MFTRDSDLLEELTQHYSLLSQFTFNYYLSSHNVIKLIELDVELTKNVDREVFIIILYDNPTTLKKTLQDLKNVDVECIVID